MCQLYYYLQYSYVHTIHTQLGLVLRISAVYIMHTRNDASYRAAHRAMPECNKLTIATEL